MISFFRKLWRDKRGNALVIAAAALPLVIGSAGLASDTIQWALWKRQVQRAADSGAIAGVYSIVELSGARTGVSDAVTRDMLYNSHINYTVTKTVGQPTGTYASDIYAVQVQLSVQQKLGFSGMFLNYIPTITATGVATVVPSGHYCVISLENTATTGITATGNADVDLGCGMITNSTSLTAAVATGSSDVNASPIAAVGGIPASTHWASGTQLMPFTMAQADPYAAINPPVSTTFPSGNCPNLNVNNQHTVMTATDFVSGSTYKPMTGAAAGAMCFNGISINGQVTFPAGSVVVLDGGSLSVGSQGSLTCDGCTFILTNRDSSSGASIGNMDFNAGATLSLKAPGTAATGLAATYQGIIVYQDRRATDGTSAGNQSRMNGNASSFMQGSLYFPSQQVTFNGTAGMSTQCFQLVARRVYYSGTMNISNSCPADSGAHDFTGKKVRLVA
jgi:Flp pilus assembly protein TadG